LLLLFTLDLSKLLAQKEQLEASEEAKRAQILKMQIEIEAKKKQHQLQRERELELKKELYEKQELLKKFQN
jgi:hypothetical protein